MPSSTATLLAFLAKNAKEVNTGTKPWSPFPLCALYQCHWDTHSQKTVVMVWTHCLSLAALLSWLSLAALISPQPPLGPGKLVLLISVGTGSDPVHILAQQLVLAPGWLHVEWAAWFSCFLKITNEMSEHYNKFNTESLHEICILFFFIFGGGK